MSGNGTSGAGTVRTASLRDLDVLVHLWIAITEHHAGFDPAFRLRIAPEDEIRQLLRGILREPDAAILAFDDGGDVPGMCIVRIDHSPPIMEETARAEITDLGVRPAARRRGIASALLDAALAFVREQGVSRVEVHVSVDNAEGQAFWRARGFADLMDVLHKRL